MFRLRYRSARSLLTLCMPNMTDSVSSQTLLERADKALDRAHSFMAFQSVDGGYYETYKAITLSAHAALLSVSPPAGIQNIRTYNDLAPAFSLHLVATGLVSPELANILRKVYDIRLDADTNGVSVKLADAQLMFGNAQRFVNAMRDLITAQAPNVVTTP
jgi:uncharacterized protein (UPF0332 family)